MAHRPQLIVAAATPLGRGGTSLDLAAIGPYASFLEASGADGAFVCGTTGEGVLLSIDERSRAARAFRDALTGRLIVHCGAQTTADTARLAADAAQLGADAVAVIPPPYFPLDAAALAAHMIAAADACAPLPFFCYVFAARSGYPFPVEAIERVREAAGNLAGLKVSDAPWDAAAPYFQLGLPVYVGSEPLIPRALAAGGAGSVSGMAAAFPDVVRAVLDAPDDAGEARLRALRGALEAGGPFIAAVKHVLGRRGIPVRADVRGPLRPLTSDEASTLDAAIDALETAAVGG